MTDIAADRAAFVALLLAAVCEQCGATLTDQTARLCPPCAARDLRPVHGSDEPW